MNDSFARFGSALVRARWIVLAMWVAVLVVAGVLLAPKASGVTKGGGFGVPGSGSQRADSLLETQVANCCGFGLVRKAMGHAEEFELVEFSDRFVRHHLVSSLAQVDFSGSAWDRAGSRARSWLQ